MVKPKKTSAIKVKKKLWLSIYTVKEFGDRFICELRTSELKTLEGKILSLNLMNITGNPKHQNVNVKFRVETANPEKGFATPIGYYMIPSGVKRLIRRRRNRLDDSIVAKTSDKVLVRIKPLILTKSKAKGSVKKTIRKNVREYIIKFVENSTYFNLFDSIIIYKMQRSIRDAIKKIYPLSVAEIRVLEIIKEKGYEKAEIKPEEKKEVSTEEKKEEVKEEKPIEGEKEVKEEKQENKEAPEEKKEAKPEKKQENKKPEKEKPAEKDQEKKSKKKSSKTKSS